MDDEVPAAAPSERDRPGHQAPFWQPERFIARRPSAVDRRVMSSSALRVEPGFVVRVKSSSEITYEGNRDRFRAQDEVVVTKVYRKDFYDGYCR